MILYTTDDGDGGTMLCATVSDLTEQMRQVLWRPEHAFVLASGTLAVGDDFHRFRSQTGLMDGRRVTESVSLSPFDYIRTVTSTRRMTALFTSTGLTARLP